MIPGKSLPALSCSPTGRRFYSTTDLATISERVTKYDPDSMIYITDKRGGPSHFEQVFRCARKTKLMIGEDVKLVHIGFGTVNGKDGKPFKTRDGGVPRLEKLITDIDEEMLRKILESRQDMSEKRKPRKIVEYGWTGGA